jgi:exodeoxyribonuclease VII large subunit
MTLTSEVTTAAITVSEFTQRIRATLEPAFQKVWIQGEISNLRPAASGHLYFSLKDANATLSCALFGFGARFRGGAKPSFDLKDGLQVLCRGKVSVYPPRGSYQLIVDQLEPMGAGALQLAFEQLKNKLSAEGLFESGRKKTLPLYPTRIAVVTSPSGAAIQDMLTILERRAPQVKVTIVPAIVQGAEAASQIVRGLKLAQEKDLGEVVVLARGGGSMEDLWCFNDENLARAISMSRLPVISAVGHEIDFTISDFVSDLRAPTPSAAAEILTGHWVDASRKVKECNERLKLTMVRELTSRKQVLSGWQARVLSPKDRLREQAQRCDDLWLRLERAMRNRVDRRRSDFLQSVARLDALSPLRVLERGYTLVFDDQNQMVRNSDQLKTGQKAKIQFHNGNRSVQVL